MIKTLSKAQKQTGAFYSPRSRAADFGTDSLCAPSVWASRIARVRGIAAQAQKSIPIRRICPDRIFEAGNQYSKSYSFTDINYAIAGKDDKTARFLDYSELLNALDSGASAKITINNRRINKAEFERSVLLPLKCDGLDDYRREYNEMLRSQVTGTNNSIVRERYLTVSVVKKNIDEARSYFARVGTDLVTHLAALSSVAVELDAQRRLQIFRDFFKAGEPAAFDFDSKAHARLGHDFKDWLCLDSMEFAADHFKSNDRWGRVLYLQGYATYLKDSFVFELCDLDRDMIESAIPHDRQEIQANDDVYYIRWQDVLAVFASYMSGAENGSPVAVLDERQIERLRQTMWDMNEVRYSTYTETVPVETDESADEGNHNGEESAEDLDEDAESGSETESATAQTVTQTVLLIELTHKTPDEMSAEYRYTARQQEYLDLLLAPEHESLCAELLGGFVQGSGEILAPADGWQSTGPLQWPLPIAGSITSPFGYRTDPISGVATTAALTLLPPMVRRSWQRQTAP